MQKDHLPKEIGAPQADLGIKETEQGKEDRDLQ